MVYVLGYGEIHALVVVFTTRHGSTLILGSVVLGQAWVHFYISYPCLTLCNHFATCGLKRSA